MVVNPPALTREAINAQLAGDGAYARREAGTDEQCASVAPGALPRAASEERDHRATRADIANTGVHLLAEWIASLSCRPLVTA